LSDTDRELRVFLCHSSQDKPVVRELYQRLNAEGWIDPWLDEEKLLPGQDWDIEIEKAVEAADAVLVFLTNNSVTKEGYVQRELKYALDIALEKPEGTIFVIPIRLEPCDLPRRLHSWQYVDYFPVDSRQHAYARLLQSLNLRYVQLSPQGDGVLGAHSVQEKPAVFTTFLKVPVTISSNSVIGRADILLMTLFFMSNAIFSFGNGGSLIRVFSGVFAMLAGGWFAFKREMIQGKLVNVILIAFSVNSSILTYALYNGWDTPIQVAYLVEGITSLGMTGALIFNARSPRIPAPYSAVTIAILLFFTGLKHILNGMDIYADFVYFPTIFAGLAAAILAWLESQV